MEILIPGSRIKNKFHISGWFKDSPGRDVNVSYYFFNNSKLGVTVDNAWNDDVDRDKLLRFLQSEGIIKNVDDWRVDKIVDTDGRTYIDESYATLILKKDSKFLNTEPDIPC